MTTHRQRNELAARVVSAVCLTGCAVAALLWGPAAFAALVAIVAAAMSWEWGRAVRGVRRDTAHFVHITAVILVCGAALLQHFWIAGLIIVVAGLVIAALYAGRDRGVSALGVFYVGVPATALIWLRSDSQYGIEAMVFMLFVIAAHDSCAMLAGKAIGGPRFWPALSPNKTWAGVAGGLTASCLAGAIFATLLQGSDVLWLSGLALVLGLAGFIGDLLESAFKRVYGLKHASGLIPGHGGVLDRFDGVVTAALLAAVVAFALAPEQPARALLFGG